MPNLNFTQKFQKGYPFKNRSKNRYWEKYVIWCSNRCWKRIRSPFILKKFLKKVIAQQRSIF